MQLADLFSILNGIEKFEGKVAYRAFPVNEAPEFPYICIMATQTDNFMADNHVYEVIQGVEIELYSEMKDLEAESALEATLNENDIPWQKYEEYIDSEEMYQITYDVEV